MEYKSSRILLSLPRRFQACVCAILVLVCLPGTAQAVSPIAAEAPCGLGPERIQRVRDIDAAIVKRGFAPGIVTQIYCDGHPLLSDVQGLSDVARDRALVADNLFRIYSMTKPLTSLAVMILAEDGRLKLDDPIARFIPEFADVKVYQSGDSLETLKTVAAARAPTIRDLLRHTAGITYRSTASLVPKMYVMRGIDNGGGAIVTPEDKSAAVDSLEEFARRIATIPLLNQPGDRFSYGNATDVLGRVVEKASGQLLSDFMRERIFKPLNMSDTAFQVPTEKVDRLTAAYWAKSSVAGDARILRPADTAALGRGNFSLAEDPRNSVFSKPRAIQFGGAGLVSTAADYQRFLQLMVGNGAIDGHRMISPESVAEMTRNQLSETALAEPNLAAQGLGFGLGFARFVTPTKAPVAVSKNLYFWGGAASTYFWVDPDRKITGVVMTQVFGGDVTPFYLDMLSALYSAEKSEKN